MRISKKFLKIVPYLISFLVIILYIPSLKGEFVWDDLTYFKNNNILTKLSLFDFKAIFESSSNYWGELLPVRDYIYILEYHFFKESPFGYHIISILLFIASGMVLYFWIRRILGDYFKDTDKSELTEIYPQLGAGIALLLFYLNPIYVESVAYISGQKDALSMLFILLSIAYLYKFGRESTKKQGINLFLGILFFYIAVLSKLSALGSILCVPFLWLITSDKSVKEKLKMFWVWIIVSIPVILWFYYVVNVNATFIGEITQTPFFDRILRSFNIIGIHISHILWPWPMTFKYPFDNIWSFDIYFGVGVLYILLLGFFIFTKLRSLVTLGLVIFGAYLLPTLQIFGDFTGGKIYDRYLDVPLIGLIIIVILGLYYILRFWERGWPLIIGVVAVVGFSLGMITHNYIPSWKSNIASSEHIYNTYPKNEELMFEYVTSLVSGGELETAEFFVTTQMNDLKTDWLREYFLGRIAYNKRNFDIICFLRHLLKLPKQEPIHYPTYI